MKLVRTIVLLTLATFLALLVGLGFLEARTAIREARNRAIAELELTGRALRPSFDEVRNTEGEARAIALIARANSDISIAQIRYVALDGEAPAVPSASLGADERRALEAGRDVALTSAADDIVVYVPVASSHGAIELAAPMTEAHAIARRMFLARVALAALATVAALAIMTLTGIVVVGRPMRALVAQARRIGAGDLSQRIHMRRRDEIGALAEEMNAMSDRLLEARARVAAETDARLHAVDQLRRADRLGIIGTLASGVAHELGTPLTVVAGRAKTLAHGEHPSAMVQQYAQTIIGQAERMTRIIRGLLDFARGKAAQKVPIDVRDLARRTLDLLAPLAKKHDVQLRVDEASADGPTTAHVDVMQIEQVLANLVVNGIQATKRGGEVSVAVRQVQARRPSDGEDGERPFLKLSVADTGTGIAARDLPRVFEPFFTTKDVGEGTGLGLSIAYGIMEEHGGFIDVESEQGRGSTFSLYFPE